MSSDKEPLEEGQENVDLGQVLLINVLVKMCGQESDMITTYSHFYWIWLCFDGQMHVHLLI